MKKNRAFLSKLMSVLLAVCMAVCIAPAGTVEMIVETVSAAETSGTCGENLTWSFDESTGTLTISGTGEMQNYASWEVPWCDLKDQIYTANIHEGVTSICDFAFNAHSNLSNLSLPSTLELIGTDAFYNCTQLSTIVIPDGVTSIGAHAFQGSGITAITIPASVTQIPFRMVEYCSNLTTMTIPNTITSIDAWVTYGCSKLADIYYNGSEEEWKAISISFRNDELMKSTVHFTNPDVSQNPIGMCGPTLEWKLDLDSGVLVIKGTGEMYDYSNNQNISQFYKDQIRKVVFEGEPTNIGKYAFQNCSMLSDVELPGSVTSIDKFAFEGCMFTSFTIPDGVTELKEHAFTNCTQLTSVVIPVSVVSMKDVTLSLFNTVYHSPFGFCTDHSGGDLNRSPCTHDNSYEKHLTDVYYLGSETQWQAIDGYDMFPEWVTIHYVNSNGTIDINDFNAYIYQANNLLDTSYPNSRLFYEQMRKNSVCDLVVANMKSNGFASTAEAYNMLIGVLDAAKDVSSLYDYALKEKELYEVLLLDMLEITYETKWADNMNKVIKPPKELVSIVNTYAEEICKIESFTENDYQNMTEEQLEQLEECIASFYDIDLKSMKNVFSTFGDVQKGVKTIEECLQNISAKAILYQLDQSVKDLLTVMYEQCPASNSALKAAIKDVNIAMNDVTRSCIELQQNEIWKSGGEYIGKIVVSEVWDKAIKVLSNGSPFIAAMKATYSFDKYLSNCLFHTDTTIEQYYKLCCMQEIEYLIKDSFASIQSTYISEPSVDNARTLISAMEMYYTALDQGCKESYAYADNLDSSIIGSIENALGDDRTENFKETIAFYQRIYYEQYISVSTSWVEYLEEDYPGTGLYEKYQSILDEGSSKIVTKEFLAACPVDVYVYDSADNLIGSVVNNRISCDGSITVIVENDQKTVLFYDNGDYRIETVGNDTGTMDVRVKEFDETESVVRESNFYDVALSSGKTYEMELSAADNTEVYQMTAQDQSVISADADTGVQTDTVNVAILYGYIHDRGENLFETTETVKATITISAFVEEGDTFDHWESSVGADIFADPYSATTTVRVPDSDVTICAVILRAGELLGDINGDNAINALDAVYFARAVAGWDGYTMPSIAVGDLNHDGVVDGKDVIYLTRYLAGWEGISLSGNVTESVS